MHDSDDDSPTRSSDIKYPFHAATNCYMLNNATLGIFCTGIPNSFTLDSIHNFFQRYGEMKRIKYNESKRSCVIIFYDIRSAVNAYVAVNNYEFDQFHALRLKFLKPDDLKRENITHCIYLKLLNSNSTPPSVTLIENFARTFGDFHFVEPFSDSCFLIHFYDYRQSIQCLQQSVVEFQNTKFAMYLHYTTINSANSVSNNQFLNDPPQFDKLDSSFAKLSGRIYTPSQSHHNDFYYHLISSIVHNYSSKPNSKNRKYNLSSSPK